MRSSAVRLSSACRRILVSSPPSQLPTPRPGFTQATSSEPQHARHRAFSASACVHTSPSQPRCRKGAKLLTGWGGGSLRMMTSAVTDGEPRQADVDEFRECLSRASRVAVLTGAGVSAASGVATFRGAGGLWRTYDAMELATPQAFAADPSVVWEFYHYRRCVVSRCSPNAGHVALVRLEHRCRDEGRAFTLITQNVDGLHAAAGSSALVELHGCLWRTRCLACGDVAENRTQPICAALDGKGAPDPSARGASIPLKDLPRCSKLPAAAASARACNGLLRPDVVWFGECLDPGVLQAVDDALTGCDLLLVVGTSGVVHPAAGFARAVRRAGGQVAEVNAEATPLSPLAQWRFLGDSATLLPLLLGG